MKSVDRLQRRARDIAQDSNNELADLRKQVDSLIHDRVQPALTSASAYADRGYSAAADGADAVGGQVRDRPIASVMLAGAIGFVLGRVTK